MRDCCYITSPIRYWGKGSTVGWYQVLGFLLLITACFDNSGFSGVVTLNSSGEVLSQWFSPFINKSLIKLNAVENKFDTGDLYMNGENYQDKTLPSKFKVTTPENLLLSK